MTIDFLVKTIFDGIPDDQRKQATDLFIATIKSMPNEFFPTSNMTDEQIVKMADKIYFNVVQTFVKTLIIEIEKSKETNNFNLN